MIFVHTTSPSPMTPWGALRHGGVNNLSAGIRAKYLVLCNVDILHRDGEWHYIFHFDARESLEMSSLAQLTSKTTKYPGDMDWKQWLGEGAQVITAGMREDILNMPPSDPLTDAIITDMREVPASRPRTDRGPGNARYQVVLPPNAMLALPGVP